MQINFDSKDSQRFVKYLRALNSSYNDKKIIILALTFTKVKKPNKNKGSLTCLEKLDIEDYIEIQRFDDFSIYQIDISYCYKMICEKNNLWILNEKEIINHYGQEWIKYFNIPNWCNCFQIGFYALTPLEKNFFKTEEVFKALKILYR